MTAKGVLGEGGKEVLGWISDTREEGKAKKKARTGKARVKDTAPPPPAEGGKWTRASFTLRASHLKKLRLEALRDGKQLKDVLDQILTKHYKGKTITVKE